MDELADEDEFAFRLIPASDEKDKQTLASVEELIKTLTKAGVHHVPPRMAYDAVDGGGISIHEFTLLLTALTGPPTAIIIAWLRARPGRKCVVKGVNGVIEAPTAAEAEALMRVQHELIEAARKGKRKRKKRD